MISLSQKDKNCFLVIFTYFILLYFLIYLPQLKTILKYQVDAISYRSELDAFLRNSEIKEANTYLLNVLLSRGILLNYKFSQSLDESIYLFNYHSPAYVKMKIFSLLLFPKQELLDSHSDLLKRRIFLTPVKIAVQSDFEELTAYLVRLSAELPNLHVVDELEIVVGDQNLQVVNAEVLFNFYTFEPYE